MLHAKLSPVCNNDAAFTHMLSNTNMRDVCPACGFHLSHRLDGSPVAQLSDAFARNPAEHFLFYL